MLTRSYSTRACLRGVSSCLRSVRVAESSRASMQRAHVNARALVTRMRAVSNASTHQICDTNARTQTGSSQRCARQTAHQPPFRFHTHSCLLFLVVLTQANCMHHPLLQHVHQQSSAVGGACRGLRDSIRELHMPCCLECMPGTGSPADGATACLLLRRARLPSVTCWLRTTRSSTTGRRSSPAATSLARRSRISSRSTCSTAGGTRSACCGG